ncbi:hypothetical protein [Paenibacillus marinisediminis]
MSYFEARFAGVDEARTCERKLQALRIPHVEMTEDTGASASGYILHADVPAGMLPIAQAIITEHTGQW